MIEEVAALKNRQQLHISLNNRLFYGANQSWLDTQSKQEDGCASVCVYNLLRYISIKDGCPKPLRIPLSKNKQNDEQSLVDMATIYDYIKPFQLNTLLPQGMIHKKVGAKYEVPSSMGIFSQRLLSKKINAMCEVRDNVVKPKVHKKTIQTREKMMEYVSFIVSNLSSDVPVLCLNTFAKTQFYLSGSSFESTQIECDKLEKMTQMKQTAFVTHWVLITGVYLVKKTSSSHLIDKQHNLLQESKPFFEDEEKRQWLIQCSTWGNIAYFYLEDLLNLVPLMQKLFPPCLATYQWD